MTRTDSHKSKQKGLALPYGRLAKARRCPCKMGIRVVWTSAWLQQKKKKNRSWTRAHTVCKTGWLVSRLGKAFDLAFDFDLPAPSGGRAGVLRSGSTGMDAGRAAMGHGWPVAAGPRSGTGVREPERSEGRTPGAKALWLLCRFYKVTRCKSETNISVGR